MAITLPQASPPSRRGCMITWSATARSSCTPISSTAAVSGKSSRRGRRKNCPDVGCGGGQSAIHMKELYPHLDLTGIDLSEDQITRARKRCRAKGVQIRIETADAQHLPFTDEEFDVVYSFGSAKHWPEPRVGISESGGSQTGGELCIADATSDATREEIDSFFDISQFPGILSRL